LNWCTPRQIEDIYREIRYDEEDKNEIGESDHPLPMHHSFDENPHGKFDEPHGQNDDEIESETSLHDSRQLRRMAPLRDPETYRDISSDIHSLERQIYKDFSNLTASVSNSCSDHKPIVRRERSIDVPSRIYPPRNKHHSTAIQNTPCDQLVVEVGIHVSSPLNSSSARVDVRGVIFFDLAQISSIGPLE
jgi:hypothetical protein